MRWLVLGLLGISAFGCNETNNSFGTGGAGSTATGTGSTSGTSTDGSSGSASTGTSGGAGNGTGTVASTLTPEFYMTNPPKQCMNQDWVSGCQDGVATSTCGGKCTVSNACQEQVTKTSSAGVTFACARYMLFSDEMLQAAVDDGLTGFNYAVAGHDVDTGGIDGTDISTCCQCYQIVFDNGNENQINVDPNTAGSPSALTVPPPLVVQSFNTGTNDAADFDIYMGAGGFGANNACDPTFANKTSVSGLYLYSSFPDDGEPTEGGVKAASLYTECKNSYSWVTAETYASTSCQAKVASACEQIAANDSAMAAATVRSCKQANAPSTPYHLNWNIYVKRVECPAHLTAVTGCKLASQGLPAVDPNVTTAAQAAADSTFLTMSVKAQKHFYTTTMQDCCPPTCAHQENVTGTKGGFTAQGLYNSFYSCDQSGAVLTE